MLRWYNKLYGRFFSAWSSNTVSLFSDSHWFTQPYIYYHISATGCSVYKSNSLALKWIILSQPCNLAGLSGHSKLVNFPPGGAKDVAMGTTKWSQFCLCLMISSWILPVTGQRTQSRDCIISCFSVDLCIHPNSVVLNTEILKVKIGKSYRSNKRASLDLLEVMLLRKHLNDCCEIESLPRWHVHDLYFVCASNGERLRIHFFPPALIVFLTIWRMELPMSGLVSRLYWRGAHIWDSPKTSPFQIAWFAVWGH